MRKKRFVISGYYGFNNFGDEAILSVLIGHLNPQVFDITVFSADPESTESKYNGIKSVNSFNFKEVVVALFKTDYLISGGGSLLQDATSFKSLLYYLGIIALALLFRKKVVIFAQGIGPITNPIGQELTEFLLQFCKYVSVRDKSSAELLKSYGIKSEVLCDPVFLTKLKPVDKTKSVTIQLRSCKNMNIDFIDRLAAKVADEFFDYEIEILPFQKSMDLEVSKQFQNSLRLYNPDIKSTIYEDLTHEEIIEKIQKSEYLLAMRFHAIVIGIIAGVKTLGINYDIKVEKLTYEYALPLIDFKYGFTDRFKQLRAIDVEYIKARVEKRAFSWRGFDTAIRN